MKIAMFHELDFGGAKRTVMEFAKRLKKNHIVDLYYVSESEDNIENYFSNVYCFKLEPKSWKGNSWKIRLYRDTIELINLYNLHKKIAREIESKKYDCVFVHPSKYTQAPFLLSFIKNKCIYYCQEPLRIVYDKYLSSISHIKFPKNIYEFINRKIRKWIDYKNFISAKIVIANSNYSKEFIQKSYGIAAEVCYLGVDTDFFKPLFIDRKIDVLFIGNKSKEYDLLNESLKFFKKKPNVYSIFRENVKTGISDNELMRIYNKSKVLAALNKNEPFGLIVIEAMACGTPVAAINEGGYRESVVDERTGFLVSRNPRQLYEKIKKIIQNGKLRHDLSKNARRYVVENWTWDKSVEKFLEIAKNEK